MSIASLQRSKSLPMTVLDMTLNHLMTRLQSWSFGECGVLLYSQYSQVHWSWVVVPVRISSMGQIELFNHLTMCKKNEVKKKNWIILFLIKASKFFWFNIFNSSWNFHNKFFMFFFPIIFLFRQDFMDLWMCYTGYWSMELIQTSKMVNLIFIL